MGNKDHDPRYRKPDYSLLHAQRAEADFSAREEQANAIERQAARDRAVRLFATPLICRRVPNLGYLFGLDFLPVCPVEDQDAFPRYLAEELAHVNIRAFQAGPAALFIAGSRRSEDELREAILQACLPF